jgi:glycosyltransferase involved in cell wall biosynthesis
MSLQMQIPEISACIVSYNQAPYIERCLQSLLDQGELHSLEILISDDGSNDGTREIIQKLIEQNPGRISLYSQEKNLGPTQNYYFIHRQARGRYVAHLDGDDFALPGKLDAEFAYLERHPDCIAVVHKLQFWDEKGNRVNRVYPKRFQCEKYNLKDLVMNHPMFLHSALMYRKGGLDALLESGPIDIVDFYVYVHLASQGLFGVIDEVLGGYTQGVGIGTKLNLIKQVEEALIYANKMGLSDSDFRYKLAGQYYSFSLKAFYDGDKVYFEKLIKQSMRTRIFSLSQVGLYLLRHSRGVIGWVINIRNKYFRQQ